MHNKTKISMQLAVIVLSVYKSFSRPEPMSPPMTKQLILFRQIYLEIRANFQKCVKYLQVNNHANLDDDLDLILSMLSIFYERYLRSLW